MLAIIGLFVAALVTLAFKVTLDSKVILDLNAISYSIRECIGIQCYNSLFMSSVMLSYITNLPVSPVVYRLS